jgi:hypothetical protein
MVVPLNQATLTRQTLESCMIHSAATIMSSDRVESDMA